MGAETDSRRGKPGQGWPLDFRTSKIDQRRLPPPSVRHFVPAGHPSRFVVWLVRERLALKQIVEPVFGRIKQARGLRQFLPRRLDKVRARAGNDPRRPQPPQARHGSLRRLASLKPAARQPIRTGS